MLNFRNIILTVVLASLGSSAIGSLPETYKYGTNLGA
jgi:hypothetical protein